MKTHKQIIDELIILAESLERVKGAKVASLITLRGKVIAYGHNHRKSHPFQAKYGNNSDCIFFHAETHVIKNALNRISVHDLSKCTLYVARVKKDNKKKELYYGLAKPCRGCQKCIEEFNINKVFYTTDEQTIFDMSRNINI